MGTPDPGVPLLKVEALSVERGGLPVLRDLRLEIKGGSGPFAIIGESGSGKTTLLYCATGLMEDYHGEISVFGKRVSELRPMERAASVGLVFQDYQLFPHLSVRENIELAPRLSKNSKGRPSAGSLLEALRIGDLADRMPHELSGGQKQRVAIARSMILEPNILFLDEPSAALDERTTLDLAELLKELNHRVQIVVVSHDRLFVEACCDRGIRLNRGVAGPTTPVKNLFGNSREKERAP
jgi:ABC-type sulfate/molybdate transport systems ATPase subunit